MAITVVGSVAYDSIETPAGRRERCLGGAATYFSLAASFFTEVRVIAVVGEDFGRRQEAVFQARGIDTRGIEHTAGKSFFWEGSYLDNLNEAKTSIRDARTERFEFLGYSFGPHYWWKNGQRYLGASPSKKSVQRIRAKISALLVPGNKGSWPEVRDQLNSLLSGWSAYFSQGTRVSAYRAVDAHVYDRVRNFLCRRHKASRRGTSRFSFGEVFGELAVLHLMRARNGRPPWVVR